MALSVLTMPGVLTTAPFYVDVGDDAPGPAAQLYRAGITDLPAPMHGNPNTNRPERMSVSSAASDACRPRRPHHIYSARARRCVRDCVTARGERHSGERHYTDATRQYLRETQRQSYGWRPKCPAGESIRFFPLP